MKYCMPAINKVHKYQTRKQSSVLFICLCIPFPRKDEARPDFSAFRCFVNDVTFHDTIFIIFCGSNVNYVCTCES